jgi:ribonuclease G
MVKKHHDNEKKSSEIFVNVGPVEKRVAILENGKLIDYFMEREAAESYAGSIYKGKVNSIVPGIEAAFVDIGMEKNGFLHVDDVIDKSAVLRELFDDEDEEPQEKEPPRRHNQRISDILKPGQEIMVQVVKEAISTKGPRLTTYISLPGRYIILTPFDNNIGISRRIKERDERKRIRGIIERIKQASQMGCIVRTMAESITEKEIEEELRYLVNLWQRIKTRAEGQRAPIKIYDEYGAVLRTLRDKFTEDVQQLVVDSKEEYEGILTFLKAFRPELRRKVKFYNGRTTLFEQYNIDKQVEEIYDRKVPLRNGGSLIIEQTEGMVAIDVNTGSFTGKRNLEDTAYKTNIEAAKEIPRQLVIRDIGGIVIIDFIDMEERDHRESVFNVLQKELIRDKAKISVRSISQFGIVEMTRQRMRKSLESTSHVECPYCHGKGMIKSSQTIGIEIARRIEKTLSTITTRHKHITVTTHPEVHVAILSDQAKMLSDIQRRYRCKIDLRDDHTMHREDFIVSKN